MLVAVLLVLGMVFREPLTDWLYRLGVLHLDVNAQLQRAEDLRQKTGKSNQSLALVEPMLKRVSNKSDLARIYTMMAVYQADQGKYAEAVQSMRQKLKVAPDDKDGSLLFARLLWKTGHQDGAKAQYQRAIERLQTFKSDPTAKSEIKEIEAEMQTGPQDGSL